MGFGGSVEETLKISSYGRSEGKIVFTYYLLSDSKLKILFGNALSALNWGEVFYVQATLALAAEGVRYLIIRTCRAVSMCNNG